MGVRQHNCLKCYCYDKKVAAMTRFNKEYVNLCMKKHKEFGNRKIVEVIKEAQANYKKSMDLIFVHK
jgi:hypothetical protein